MGRRRAKGKDGLPKGVYQDAYGYFIKAPYRRIARTGATRAEIWTAFEQIKAPDDRGTLSWLVREYLKSERFLGLAAKTRKEAEAALNRLTGTKTRAGVFGDAQLASVTPGVLRRYLDARKKPIAANRELSYLSAAFSWAFERDMVETNPCKGVRRNKETARTRYVTDEEYREVYDRAPVIVQIFMELAYLCAARKIEILDLRRSDLLTEGVQMRRRKGSKDNIIRWSPRLEAAVNAALGLPCRVSSMYLLHDQQGQPIKSSSLDTAWQRLAAPFTMHDLKRKGVSDSRDSNPAGHRDPRMRDRYRVKPDEVEPPA